jgi:hypothetical protein
MNRCARGLAAAGISVIALGGAVGIARAQPEPSPPPVPSILDQLVGPLNQSLWINPNDEGGPTTGWGGTGMFCENQWVRCR